MGRTVDGDKGRGNIFNSEGWKVSAPKKMRGEEKKRNLGKDEFPAGLSLQRKLKRFLLIGPGDPRQDLPDPQDQNSQKLGWGKENEFRPNCHFGDRLNRTTSARTGQKSIPEIS
jgi:hypothetical protein